MQYKLWRLCCRHLNVHCSANVYLQSFSHISDGKCLISQKSWFEKTLPISVHYQRYPCPHMSCDERYRRQCHKRRRWNWAKANLLQATTPFAAEKSERMHVLHTSIKYNYKWYIHMYLLFMCIFCNLQVAGIWQLLAKTSATRSHDFFFECQFVLSLYFRYEIYVRL